MINVNEFKPGMTFKHDGFVYIVLESSHSKSGRGQATVKVKVKNLENSSNVILSFTGGTKVEKAYVESNNVQFLYFDSNVAYFMNNESFEQFEISIDDLGSSKLFLKEGIEIKAKSYEGKIIGVELPVNITLEVVEAPDAVQGNTVSNATKKIKLETGIEIDAPQFIKPGDKIVINTETKKYVGKG